MKPFLKNNWFGLATVIISSVILAVAMILTGGAQSFSDTVMYADPVWILSAFLFIILYWILDSLILNVFTRTEYKKYPYRRSFAAGMIGLLYSALTPFAVGGQPMQIYEMSKTGIKSGDACSYVTIKSILYQTCMTFLSISALFFARAFFAGNIKNFALYVVFGLVTNLLFIGAIILACFKIKAAKRITASAIYLLAKIRLVKQRKKALLGALRQINVFSASVRTVSKRMRTLVLCVILTFFELIVFYCIPYCIFRSFGLTGRDIAPIHGAVANIILYMICTNAIITMITSFIPLPGASGAAEGSFYLFFGLFFPHALVLPAVIIWRFITYYCCIIVGSVVSLLKLTGGNIKPLESKP